MKTIKIEFILTSDGKMKRVITKPNGEKIYGEKTKPYCELLLTKLIDKMYENK